ncbi:MAG: RNA-binding protein [Gammaproteobacteria bacterium]|uniref:Heat shock protein 15 n=1 Tax=OM182 bacterium MED-G24 TaxID=1986255 RepID=A0A2A5WTL6_9GAMM|nr:RNA-binding protein [Gammaproteobacteria bacterium]PDH39603.1 MAG: RNA-binding protein [OM182 bacterium MED-G24]RPG27255.1 MAG: RNA-binding protein [Gammaproteobacteria bacterium TMED50]
MEKVRLDKWLWAARFFRTRAKAKLAINGGKVHVDGIRAKPSKEVIVGETLQIRQGYDEKVIVVTALSDNRGNATAAALLYQETEASLALRDAASERRKLAGNAISSEGKPSKKQRRRIIQFREQID